MRRPALARIGIVYASASGEQRRALLGRERAPGAAEDAGGFGGEVPAAGEQLRRGAVRDHAAVGEQHRALGAGAGELGVVRGHDHRVAARGAAAQLLGELRLREAVHAARGLVERQHRGLLSPVGDDRERQALALPAGEVAGVALRELGEAGERERTRGGLARDALVHEVVAGVLQQQRDAPAALDPPAGGLHEAGGVTQQRGLAGAVAPHQGDAFAWLQPQLGAAQDRGAAVELVPHTSHSQRRSGARGRTRAEEGAPCLRLPMFI